MSSSSNLPVVVIGAGPAGYVCAIRLAQLGQTVTVIDADELGGVCLNRGCIPSKALIHIGSFVEKIHHASEIGIEVGKPKIDFPKVMKWKESVVKKLTGGVGSLLKANGCTVVKGFAKFKSPTGLEVKSASGTQTLAFKACVIATGSRPIALPAIPVDQKNILDSTGALELQEVPDTLLCIGGGYIGLELGTFYAKMGSKVTVVEAGDRILGSVDPDLVKVVERGLTKRGVQIRTKAMVVGCKSKGQSVEVTFSEGGKTSTATFSKVLMTVGRIPNSDQLNLAAAGVKLDAKGFVVVDSARKTNVPNIFAIGDIAGQPLLAHKGSKEGLVAAEVISGKRSAYDVVGMPAVVFTDPEVAVVGLTESEAKSKGIDVQIGMFPFAANGRALSIGDSDGFVKMVGDKKTGRLMGVHIVGPEASNLIAEATLALEMGATVEDLALTVHAHPTLPESIMEAAEATLGHAIHVFQKRSAHP